MFIAAKLIHSMKRRNFLYMGGVGATGAAITAAMPAWAKTALRSINKTLNYSPLMDPEIQYGVDSEGNLFWRFPGKPWTLLKIQLDNVIIDVGNPAISWIDDSVVPGGPNTLIWNYGGGGGGSAFPPIMDTFAEITNSPVYQGVNIMMSSIGASLAGLDVSAAALKIADEIPNFLGVTGKVVAGIGVADNAIQMYKEGINWTDAVQTAIGVALIGVALANPVGAGIATAVFIAELGLFLWELSESEY